MTTVPKQAVHILIRATSVESLLMGGMRRRAIRLGAKEITQRELVAMMTHRK